MLSPLKIKLGCKWETSTWFGGNPKGRSGGFDSLAAGDFYQCLFDIDMEDLVTKGIWFSWSNRRGGMGDSRSKFDRAVVNGHWLDCFTECEACLLSPGVSDHCLLMVTVLKEVSCKKLFKFLNFWMNHNQFQEKEGQSWSQPMAGSAMFCLAQKWKRLKPNLKDLNSHFYSDMSKRVFAAKEDLDQLQIGSCVYYQEAMSLEYGYSFWFFLGYQKVAESESYLSTPHQRCYWKWYGQLAHSWDFTC